MAISGGPVSGGPVAETQASPPVRDYPYLIQAGATLQIASVRVELHGAIAGPKIRGTNVHGFNVSETPLSHLGGDVYEASNLSVATAFTADVTAFYDTFDIWWEVSLDGTTWRPAGTSRNQIYVCLADPISNPNPMLRTAVHLACSNAGASTATAASQTWALFSTGSGPTDVKTWNGMDLYYYQPGYNFSDNTDKGSVTVPGLLTIGRGQCGAWTVLLRLAWAVNGITSSHITARCAGAAGFWVKDWSLLTTSRPFWFQGPAFDMIPTPLAGALSYYDDPSNQANFVNLDTIKGQGTAGTDKCPSEKCFENHQFALHDGTYYDPSYGVTYTDEANFQSTLAGWATIDSVGTYLKLQFHNFTGSTIVVFS